ncbi:MAG: hypothetical protein ACP5NI_00155 [Acetobacteraceae bacterium]
MTKPPLAVLALGASLLAAPLFAAGAARAQEHPLFEPTRDVAVTYQVTGQGPSRQMTMDFAPSLHKMRINGMGPGYMIIDHAAHEAMMVMPPQRMVVKMAGMDPWAQHWRAGADLHFTRAGSDTVAGVSCQIWHVTTSRGEGTACITADGVPLRMMGQGGKGLVAVSVAYGPQPAALFAVPPGYRVMAPPPMPAGAPGAPGGGMPGMMPGMGAP